MTSAPAGLVLLAAGRGSRLSPLTDQTHKSLLPVAGRPVLQYAIDEALARGVEDIVVVTGDKRAALEDFVLGFRSDRLRYIFNARFAEDTNILSTALGVETLRRPEDGYLILETDLVVEPAGWRRIFEVGDGGESYWVTRGAYGPTLVGGALRADAAGRVIELVYTPHFDPTYSGWQKLVGALYVGRDQVALDRNLRQRGIERTISQYYMAPWVEHLGELDCCSRPLDELFAESFNDPESYRSTDRRFSALSSIGSAK
jgi:CTP:molybdopterin cytidylyltransferase MocA